ncbi:MAG TPA: hypothetical protein VLF89_00790 [Candidatus Saccharimonadales bacterium]|nr:hypothetical protein [Candidatus Saccharimonadales bacterium]
MKFSRKQHNDFGWNRLNGWVYNTKEDFANISNSYIEITGTHGKVKNVLSDISYFVIDGTGEFFVKDIWVSVKKEDVIIIPKDTPYDYRAKDCTMKLLCMFTPAFDPKFDIKLV